MEKQESEEELFLNICNNVTSGVVLAQEMVEKILNLNTELIKYSLPNSLQLHFSLTSSKLQRHFSSLKSQVEEMVRLIKLYSVSWEKKSQSLKLLHEQYNSKQRRLDIALKKIEHLSHVNQGLQKQRVQRNWEKMFLKVTQSQMRERSGWQEKVELYKQLVTQGKSVAHLFQNLDTPDYISYKPESCYATSDMGASESMDSLLREDSRLLNGTSDTSEIENEFLKIPSEMKNSVSEWLSRSDNDSFISHEIPNNSLVFNGNEVGVIEFTDHKIQTEGIETKEKYTSTEKDRFVNKLRIQVSHPVFWKGNYAKISCKVVLNKHVESIHFPVAMTEKGTDEVVYGTNNFEHLFEFDEENLVESEEFHDARLKITFLADGTIVAFFSTYLSELVFSFNQIEEEIQNTEEKRVNELNLLSTVDSKEVKFNEPCGNFYLNTYISQTLRDRNQNQTTQTLSLNELFTALNWRSPVKSKSISIETEEKPLYTDTDVSLIKNEFECKLQEVQANYEDKLRTLAHENDTFFDKSPAQEDNNEQLNVLTRFKKQTFLTKHATPVKMKLYKKWGKDLPNDFFERLEMFNVASEEYHKKLKLQTRENVDLEISKRLQAEKKLSNRAALTSAYERDVFLPAIFMPIKSKQTNCHSARSYLSSGTKNQRRHRSQISLLKLTTQTKAKEG